MYKFLKRFPIIAKALFVLTEEQMKFVWSKESQETLDSLKLALTTAPVLSFLLENGQIILNTDASRHRIGTVLSQV